MAFEKIPENLALIGGFIFLLVLSVVALLKRRDIARLVVGKSGFEVVFADKLDEVRRQASQSPDLTFREPETYPGESKLSDGSTRDMVLERWGSLKQVVFDSVAAQNITTTLAMNVPQAVDRLCGAGILSPMDAEILKSLYQLGHQLSMSSDAPRRSDAFNYRSMVDSVRDWLMTRALSATQESKPPPRETRIARSLPMPSSGHPMAVLECVAGPLYGRRFSMEKERFRIGSDDTTDLAVTGDNYVSGLHASLRYQNGKLWLRDEGSTNGTFLNGKKLRGGAVAVTVGDSIRVGKSTFKATLE